MREQARHRKIVGDDNHRKPQFIDQPAHEIAQPRLN